VGLFAKVHSTLGEFSGGWVDFVQRWLVLVRPVTDSNLSFLQALTEACKLVPNAMLLGSLPESEVEAGSQRGVAALRALEKTFGRIQALWKPVATEEAFVIVRRRLFEPVSDAKARETVCRAFADAYISEGIKMPSKTHEGRYLNSYGDKTQDATSFWFDTRANLRREMEDRKKRFEDKTRTNGSKPRYRGNRLIFLAPDHGTILRFRDCIRTALAWASIVDDVAQGRLNIDQLQKKQADKELQLAADVLPRAARECYKWLLCPAQQSPTDAKPAVEAFPLNTAGSALGSEIERVCVENELVITTWSPIHLRTSLKTLYWKADKPACGALAFWEDTQRYCYLPRLKTRDVLAQAIIKGAASKDFFGTAYAQIGATFEGFKLGDPNVQLDDTLLHSILVSDPNATVNVTVEIGAEFPNGAPDHIKRAVSENANSLGLKNKSWE